MKIKQVTEVDITFDNGNRIYFDHEQDRLVLYLL